MDNAQCTMDNEGIKGIAIMFSLIVNYQLSIVNCQLPRGYGLH